MIIKRWVDQNWRLHQNLTRKNDSGENEYLLANFSESEQRADIEKRVPLINDFARIKINVKRLDDEEVKKYNLEPVNESDYQDVLKASADEFDMPLWASDTFGLPPEETRNHNDVFITQTKGCNIHCPWCFVDDWNKNGVEGKGSRYKKVSEIIDFFEEEKKGRGGKLGSIRFSGGEPLLTPTAWTEVLGELKTRGLENEVYFQGETNLVSGRLIETLQKVGKLDKDFFEQVAQYNNFGVLCSFKGTDTHSFLRATGMQKQYSFLEQDRWNLFGDMTKAGINAFPFIYDPNPNTLESFMHKGADKFGENFYLKTWVFSLKLYGPEKTRMKKAGLNPVEEQIRLDENFKKSEEIMYNLVLKETGQEYKKMSRTGVRLDWKIKE